MSKNYCGRLQESCSRVNSNSNAVQIRMKYVKQNHDVPGLGWRNVSVDKGPCPQTYNLTSATFWKKIPNSPPAIAAALPPRPALTRASSAGNGEQRWGSGRRPRSQ